MRLRVGDEDVLLACIADGAGSATHSQIGSSEAVQHLLELVARAGLDLEKINKEQVAEWYESVLMHLKSVAERQTISVNELACTLLLAIVWKNGAVLGQVGDGAWVIEKDGVLVAGTWPENAEYANVTVFLTSRGATENLQFQKLAGEISGIAGFTDGLQNLVLNYKDRMPHLPFFKLLFDPLRSSSDETELIAPLKQMLASEVITSLTDDDKSLVVGVWRKSPGSGATDGTPE